MVLVCASFNISKPLSSIAWPGSDQLYRGRLDACMLLARIVSGNHALDSQAKSLQKLVFGWLNLCTGCAEQVIGCLHLLSLSCAGKVLLAAPAQPTYEDTPKKAAWSELGSEPPLASPRPGQVTKLDRTASGELGRTICRHPNRPTGGQVAWPDPRAHQGASPYQTAKHCTPRSMTLSTMNRRLLKAWWFGETLKACSVGALEEFQTRNSSSRWEVWKSSRPRTVGFTLNRTRP